MTNSLIAVAINLIGMLLIYSLLANAITRFYWRGRGTMGVVGIIIVAGLFWMLPPFLIPYHSATYALWIGNLLVSGFSVVILCQSVRWIPRQLEDSARLDGCGRIGTYRHVVLPLVRRELGLIAFLTLMATLILYWTALTGPRGIHDVPPWFHLILPTQTEHGPGAIRILLTVTAGSIITTLPVMVIFLLSQRWFPRPVKLGTE